ncbi:MAG: ABC transporter permease [Acidobacteria bacterium]|nr:ABC transporter permease [Acidobacteriota bacterium]
MVNRLILSNLIARPVRSMLTVLAVAVEVVLIMMVVGLTHGIVEESGRRVQGVGAEIMVQPPTTSIFMGLSGAPLPIQIAERLAQVPHVKAVAPVMVQVSTTGGVTLIYGIPVDRFTAVSGGFRFLEGRGLEASDEVLVDDIHAHAHNLHVGQTVELLNQPFRVAGIVEHGQGARIFMPIETLQDLMGSVGKASVFFVKLTDPQQTSAVVDEMRRLLPGYQVRDMHEYLTLMTTSNLPGLDNFIRVMIALAVSIGLFVIFITMYSTIVERTREIGILKSMGASKGYVIKMVLREASVLTLLGIGSGIGLSYAVRSLVGVIFPTLPILITAGWMLRACLIALAASLVGAGYPAFRATKLDAIQALAYE